MGWAERSNKDRRTGEDRRKEEPLSCPHCTCDDASMLEKVALIGKNQVYLCNSCSKQFIVNV